ncbi:hypothetical protein [Bradyrhizobium iriomotense]|uniref:hypothetical protein n=1 Tax=Bradyrhizobium iriomotense TaxID=441950 RepID=UPI0024E145D0|nr:hypothetical protein [Bradyrhizobium iriomotense]
MKLVWSRFALSDRDRISSYTEAENPHAAIPIDEPAASSAGCPAKRSVGMRSVTFALGFHLTKGAAMHGRGCTRFRGR